LTLVEQDNEKAQLLRLIADEADCPVQCSLDVAPLRDERRIAEDD
jgi:hypothetical protein